MLIIDVTVGSQADSVAAEFLAVADAFPEFVGHGETPDGATDDLLDQLNDVVWH